MHVKLSDFVASGHTVEWNDVTYKVPVGATDVLLEKIAIEIDGARALQALSTIPETAEAEGWADDDDRIKQAIGDRTREIEAVTARMIELATRLLQEANPGMGDVVLPSPAAMAVIRLSLGETEEVTAQQIAARAIGLEAAEGPAGGEGVADPPTRPKAKRAASSRSRSRTPSLTR